MLSIIEQLNFKRPDPPNKRIRNRVGQGKGPRQRLDVVNKYIAVLTDKWQPTTAISEKVGRNQVTVRKFLTENRDICGKVESKIFVVRTTRVKMWRIKT